MEEWLQTNGFADCGPLHSALDDLGADTPKDLLWLEPADIKTAINGKIIKMVAGKKLLDNLDIMKSKVKDSSSEIPSSPMTAAATTASAGTSLLQCYATVPQTKKKKGRQKTTRDGKDVGDSITTGSVLSAQLDTVFVPYVDSHGVACCSGKGNCAAERVTYLLGLRHDHGHGEVPNGCGHDCGPDCQKDLLERSTCPSWASGCCRHPS